MEKIDFVVTWVDGNDPEWQKEKSLYDKKKNTDSTIFRYRDWDLFRYWFRSVEKFTPWVNKIFFITWGHLPSWLDTSNPKLVIVKHTDFIPKEYLPTFNSNAIELNIHRIKGLSENFVLFNDDFFLLKPTKPEAFFKKGIPVDTAALNVHCPKKSLISQYFCINDVNIINEYFDMKKTILKNFWKWFNLKNGKYLFRTIALFFAPRFPGFWQPHLTSSICKKTIENLWNIETELLNETSLHKFRESSDINQWLFREWQIAEGNFKSRNANFGKVFFIDRDGIQKNKDEILSYIKKQKGHIISINDGPMREEEFSDLKKELKQAFHSILPEKSSFEKKSEDLISVIIPCYKVEKTLSRCVDSVLRQTHTNLEIILVDDGSPDNSGKICDEYAGKDSRIKVIHKENGGLSSARNAGLDIAKGKFVGFVDSDDWIEPDMYDFLLQKAKEFDGDIVSGAFVHVTEETIVRAKNPGNIRVLKKEDALNRFLFCAVASHNEETTVCNKLYKIEMFQNNRFPMGKYFEDISTTYNLLKKANIFVSCDKICYYYFQNTQSITRDNLTLRHFDFIGQTKYILDDYKGPNKENAKLCRQYYAKSFFTVLVLYIRFGKADNVSEEKLKELVRDFKKHFRQIMKSKLPFIKKLAAIYMYITLR